MVQNDFSNEVQEIDYVKYIEQLDELQQAKRELRFKPRIWQIALLLAVLIAGIFAITRIGREPAEPPLNLPEVILPLGETTQNSDIIIVLDAGHGGSDVGSMHGGVMEKDLNLKLTQALGSILEEKGYCVVYTRKADEHVSLGDRVNFANQVQAHLFISVHCNAADSTSASGIEVYYSKQPGSDALAKSVSTAMLASLGAKDRGCANGNYIVLTRTDMTGILIESGFISNAEERAKLTDESYQQKLTAAIADGIESYISTQKAQ